MKYHNYNYEKLNNALKAIKKRPGMYLGFSNSRGIFSMFTFIFDELSLKATSRVFISLDKRHYKIKIENIDLSFVEYVQHSCIATGNYGSPKYFGSLYIPMAISTHGKIVFKSSDGALQFEQSFKNGEIVKVDEVGKICNISSIEMEFELDYNFFHEGLLVNHGYLLEKFEEYALCNKKVYFELSYFRNDSLQKQIFYSENGLKDKIDRVVLDKYDKSCLPITIDTKLDDFSLELSFKFLTNSIDKAYLKSYVNSQESVDHGTHLDAVLKGIKEALIAYLEKEGVANKYLVTRQQILRYILLMVQIKMENPNYAGSVRDRLTSEYIEASIIPYVKEIVLDELEKYPLKDMEFLKVFKNNWVRGGGQVKIYQVDAFATKPFEGNPAMVCPLECWLSDEQMQQIAEENNLSETAFFVKEGDLYHLRWFTPTAEVDMCGHATLASAYILFIHMDYDNKKEITFSTKSGLIRVWREGLCYVMDFPIQAIESCDISAQIEVAFGVKPIATFASMDYIVVFENEEDVVNAKPNLALLKALDLRGVCITAKSREYDFVTRFFAPKIGVDEDPVTGSAFTQLISYWVDVLGKDKMIAKQVSKRGGKVHCRLKGDRVEIGGRAEMYLEGVIDIEVNEYLYNCLEKRGYCGSKNEEIL